MSGADILLPAHTMRLGEANLAQPPPCSAAKEAIHSGHFMVSNFEPDDEAEDERLNVPILEEPSSVSEGSVVEVVPQDSPGTVQKLAIDGSLTKLFNTLTIAYNEQISNPRWNMFKGMKLNMKDKIRLNNVIWRCWHIQFVKKQNRGVCHFVSSPEGEQHKPDAVVLEGKYWKRKPEAVTAEYKKWRMFNKKKNRSGAMSANALPAPDWSTPLSSSLETNSMDMDLDFSDGLMDMLMQQPYTFPNPREIRVGCADFIQPSLVQLQPNLSDMDLMDTLEPLQDLLSVWQDSRSSSRLPTVDEEPQVAPPGGAECSDAASQLPMVVDHATDREPTRLPQPPPPPPVPPTAVSPPALSTPPGSRSPLQPQMTLPSPQRPQRPQQSPQQLTLGQQLQQPQPQQQVQLRPSGAEVLQSAVVMSSTVPVAVPMTQIAVLSGGGSLFVPPPSAPPPQQQPQTPQRESRARSHSTRSMAARSAETRELHRRNSLSEIQRARAAGAMERSVSDSSGIVRRLASQPQPVPAAITQASVAPPGPAAQVTMLSQLLAPSRTGQLNSGALASIAAASSAACSPPPRLSSPSVSFSMPSPPSRPVASPPELSASRGVYKEQRRAVHINAEQKRRGSIKSGFDVLYSLVPALRNNSANKVSKAAMLHQGAEYIRELKTERTKLQSEAEDLRREIERLNQQINNYQAMLPATGAPISRARQSKMQEMFEEYVRERTVHNWRFYVFSKLLSPLLESYSNTVSTANLDELCRTVLTWQEQSCGLVQFRPRATMALCELSKTTSILSDPQRLPMEAVNAVTRLQRPRQPSGGAGGEERREDAGVWSLAEDGVR